MNHEKLALTGTVHPLPFDKLSSLDLEWLCLWLVEREGYKFAEHVEASGGEQGAMLPIDHNSQVITVSDEGDSLYLESKPATRPCPALDRAAFWAH